MRTPILLCTFALAMASPAAAQLRTTKVITLEGAKNIVTAAEAEAKKNGWNMAYAVVDVAGELILFHKGDGARPSNAEFAMRKARTSARYQRDSRLLDSALTAGRLAFLATDALPIQGGVAIIVDGQVIGAVGVSGGSSQQDEQVAKAGIAALIQK
jgi:glc operon protein GlcG